MRNPSSKYTLEESLGNLATQFSRAALKRINRELPLNGIPVTSEQWSVLVNVWQENGQPQCALAAKLDKDKATFTRIIAGIEAQGLVVRVPGPKDAREKIVYLTDEGKRVMDRATGIVQGILDVAKLGIPEEDLRICKGVLRKAYANLK
jgi:MarR family transcriptional regulator, organic hydroperoxide resistance regulator